MPTLNWIGKDKVLAHHQEVPYHILESEYTYNAATSGNRIIHGDNLTALKSLLPQYEGRIKCIYIDPPYNTGNEGWVYNDRVNDPKILKWLHSVVGKEGEDLSRHDKWLCMMYPRLRLLHKLLAPDGAIFISIDDNEQASLKMMMDEIFGVGKSIGPLIWRSRQNVDARNKSGVSNDHEYILIYRKGEVDAFRGVSKDLEKFDNPDNDERGPWRSADLTGIATKSQRPNLHYELTDPQTGIVFACPEKGWRYDRNTMAQKIAERRILFPSKASGRPRHKLFMLDMGSQNKALSSVITDYTTGDGTTNLKAIFGTTVFDFPKPPQIIEMLLDQVADKDSIILDSFAGSGTTAHAILNLNQRDGGTRKFILVEMEDYAGPITAERVKRVIDGYGTQQGTGGSFTYATVGAPLFYPNNTLNEAVPVARIREYIWYSETATPLEAKRQKVKNESPETAERAASNGEASPTLQAVQREASKGEAHNPYFLGSKDDSAYYFYYEPDALTTLDDAFLSTIRVRAGTYIIYADTCLLSKPFMQAKGIIFKKIPRDITRF